MLCFQHLTPGDLLLGPAKVVGSAQRRHQGGLLQHGAILLAASPHAPVLPGIRELTGKSLTAPEVCQAVTRQLAGDTGWRITPGEWTDSERRRVEELARHKYSQASWNQKR
ncbi:MAG: lipoate--protein ligase family protein [Planctomycetes bacterium]|nr:lipoate--protein ligase family protein [Planctomycetota bacterium]